MKNLKQLWKHCMNIKTGILLISLWVPMTGALAQPLSLQEAVDMALKNGTDIKIAAQEAEKARLGVAGARGGKEPSISLRSGVTFQDAANKDSSTNNSNSLQLSLPVYTGGKLEATLEKAQQTLDASVLQVKRTRQNTKLKVASAYYQVLQAKSMMAVNEETVKNNREHVKNVRALYGAGSIAKSDVLRSDVELANAEQALLKQQNAYALAVSSLKNIIKERTQNGLDLSDSLEPVPFNKGLEDCLSQGKEIRPDILIEKINVDKALKDLEIAKSDKLPSLSLSASTSWDNRALPSSDNYANSVGLSASWNVFDGNVTQSKVRQAQINIEQARLKLAELEDTVAEEIRQPYLSMREAEKRLRTTQIAIDKATEDYFIAREKYKAGEGILLDILDAQLSLSTAKSNYIQAQYDYAVNRVKLENAVGID